MKINSIRLQHSIFLLYILSLISFFVPLNDQAAKGIQYLFYILLVSISIKTKKATVYSTNDKARTYSWYLFLFSICFSIIPAKIYWGQSYIASMISILPFLMYTLYFLLLRLAIDKTYIEKCIKIIALIYILLLFVKYIFPEIPIGSIIDDSNRGKRVVVAGSFFNYFFFFKILSEVKDNCTTKRIILLILSFAAILLPMTRQRIIVTILLGGLLLLKGTSLNKKFVISIISVALLVPIAMSDWTKSLVKMTNAQFESKDPYDHIREIGILYYLTTYPEKGINTYIGNGVPSYGRSHYGNNAEEFAEETKIYLVDISLIAIYHYFGVLGLFALIYIFISFILHRESDHRYTYCKYLLMMLLLNSITSGILILPEEFVFVSICAYLLTPQKRKSNDRRLCYNC